MILSRTLSAGSLSMLLHALAFGALALVAGRSATSPLPPIEVSVMAPKPEPSRAPVDLTKRPPTPPRGLLARGPIPKGPPPPPSSRPVFGVKMEALVVGGPAAPGEGVALPVGDTLRAEPPKDKPVAVYEVTDMPKMVREVRAPFPEEARRGGLEGQVILELTIDETGRVVSARVVRGAGHGFDEAAVQALLRSVFTPAKIGDKPVPVKIRYTYSFVLD